MKRKEIRHGELLAAFKSHCCTLLANWVCVHVGFIYYTIYNLKELVYTLCTPWCAHIQIYVYIIIVNGKLLQCTTVNFRIVFYYDKPAINLYERYILLYDHSNFLVLHSCEP